MQIECPHCSKENNLKLEKKVVCGECKEELTGYKYRKYSKPIISATTALMMGAFGYKQFDKYLLEDHRYPIKVEYSIVESCLNLHKKPISNSTYSDKRDICLCSLEETMNEISYSQYRNKEDIFVATFSKMVSKCNKNK